MLGISPCVASFVLLIWYIFLFSSAFPSLADEPKPLDALYADLANPALENQWHGLVEQIALHGRSDTSTSALLAHLKQEIPDSVEEPFKPFACRGRIEVFMYLALTGGEEAQTTMRDAFLNNADYATQCMPCLDEYLTPGERDSVIRSIRGRAAIGLLMSGNKHDEKMVRKVFRDLRKRFSSLEKPEERFFWVLVDSLAIGDMIEARGSQILFERGAINSDVLPSPIGFWREKYLPKGYPSNLPPEPRE